MTPEPTDAYLWASEFDALNPPADTDEAAERLHDLSDEIEQAGLSLWAYRVRRAADDIAAMS